MTILNGLLPALMLVIAYSTSLKIRSGKPASSWKRMSQRSHAKGYGFLRATNIYRAYKTQADLFYAHYVPQSKVAGRHVYDSWWFKGQVWCRVSGTARIAPPGQSNHGLGLAADLMEPYASTGPKHSWLERICYFYGWRWTGKGFGEPWHWEYVGMPARPALHKGLEGDAVTAWQCVLRYDLHLSADEMKMDGIAGPKFDHYTRVWQKVMKLTADGIVGPASWKKAGLA